MATLVHIEASPRKDRSYSIAVARAFVETYKETHPEDSVETLDLWKYPLPAFDGEMLNAKYAVLHGEEHSPEQAEAWESVKRTAHELFSCDKLLFSLPMWNFGLPYKLKHFIDVVTQPTVTFNLDEDGSYAGLVPDKPTAVICARGGAYFEGSGAEGLDFQKPYFEMWLGYIGLQDIRWIIVEPTLSGKDQADGARREAIAAAQEIARDF